MNRRDGFLRTGSSEKRTKLDALEGHAPPTLNVADWVNTGGKNPKLSDLKGQVVLLDFWSGCSIRVITSSSFVAPSKSPKTRSPDGFCFHRDNRFNVRGPNLATVTADTAKQMNP